MMAIKPSYSKEELKENLNIALINPRDLKIVINIFLERLQAFIIHINLGNITD